MRGLCLFVFLCVFARSNALKYESKNGLIPARDECGVETSATSENKFPWVVYIPLATRTENPDAHIRCAGVIINKRFIITNKSSLQFVLTNVTIGAYDTTDLKDTTTIEVEKRITNEHKDIILLKLAKDIDFNDRVKPICLPFDNFKELDSSSDVYTSGWGLTDVEGKNTVTKKEVKLGVVAKDDCLKSGQIKDLNNKYDICVKVQNDSKGQPCNGDEGSPIMYKDNDRWVLEGILINVFDTHYKPCAKDDPAVGSAITDDVLQWIVDHIDA